MNKLLKKYSLKIPNNVTVLYCNNKKIITVIGPLNKKSIRINLELKFLQDIKVLFVTSNSLYKVSNSKKKATKALRGTSIALIKQMFLETTTVLYKKLKFIGVGYKVFYSKEATNNLLLFKLGFSHSIYFKIPNTIKIFCFKQTKLFLYGTSYQSVAQITSLVRSCKSPEPYKGKGILYENEKIKLKEGKKT